MLRLTLLVVLVSQLYAFQFNPRVIQYARQNTIRMSTEETAVVAAGEEVKVVHQVFIGNLPFEVQEGELGDLVNEKLAKGFSQLRIATDKKTGRSRGFGYIHFEEKEAAEAASVALQGLQVKGRDVKIDLSEHREQKPRMQRTPTENSAFIGNLNFDITADYIQEMLDEKLGKGVAIKVRLTTDRETGRPRGFGHIDFVTPEDATRAIEALNGLEVMGRSIKVDHAQRRDPNAPVPVRTSTDRPPRPAFNQASRENSIFLGNLAWDVTEEMCREMLTDVLGPDGGFLTVRLATDRETGRPRGFGHIDFKDSTCAERAITELNGMEVLGRLLRVDYAQKRETPRE